MEIDSKGSGGKSKGKGGQKGDKGKGKGGYQWVQNPSYGAYGGGYGGGKGKGGYKGSANNVSYEGYWPEEEWQKYPQLGNVDQGKSGQDHWWPEDPSQVVADGTMVVPVYSLSRLPRKIPILQKKVMSVTNRFTGLEVTDEDFPLLEVPPGLKEQDREVQKKSKTKIKVIKRKWKKIIDFETEVIDAKAVNGKSVQKTYSNHNGEAADPGISASREPLGDQNSMQKEERQEEETEDKEEVKEKERQEEETEEKEEVKEECREEKEPTHVMLGGVSQSKPDVSQNSCYAKDHNFAGSGARSFVPTDEPVAAKPSSEEGDLQVKQDVRDMTEADIRRWYEEFDKEFRAKKDEDFNSGPMKECSHDILGLFHQGEKRQIMMAEHGRSGERISITIDSGAAESVMPKSACADYPILPGEWTGSQYGTADGGVITNLGERTLVMDLQGGTTRGMLFQVGDKVTKPLGAVSRIADRGNRVVFEAGYGFIENIKTHDRTYFQRKDDVYSLEALVRPHSANFRRQS